MYEVQTVFRKSSSSIIPVHILPFAIKDELLSSDKIIYEVLYVSTDAPGNVSKMSCKK